MRSPVIKEGKNGHSQTYHIQMRPNKSLSKEDGSEKPVSKKCTFIGQCNTCESLHSASALLTPAFEAQLSDMVLVKHPT